MPIYEFYCNNCQTIYQFFSKSINTAKFPSCPKCENKKLQRAVSMFATLSNQQETGDDENGLPPIDESRMEKAMAMMAREAENINEDDPRQAANFMRKLSREAGIKLGGKMEEAISRMEKGEDPDKIEEDMGDSLNDDDLFLFESQKMSAKKKGKIKKDDTIYDL